MLVRNLKECRAITALDGTTLRELLNPLHDGTEIKLGYSIAHASIRMGTASLPHRLTKASEVYYILEGRGVIHVGKDTFDVSPGTLIYVPPKATQYLENTGDRDLVFLCIVDPYWQPDEEELINSQKTETSEP